MLALLYERLRLPVLLFAGVFVGGTLGYWAIGRFGAAGGAIPAPWPLLDCAFMTTITLTTIGYGDILTVQSYPLAEIYTIVLAFAGMGVVLFVVSETTSFLVEGHLGTILKERSRMKRIEGMRDHLIVCGLGETGTMIAEEFLTTRHDFVAIEKDPSRCARRREAFPEMVVLEGDATWDETLKAAGIERARGLAAALGDDKDNLFLVVTARSLRPDLAIVSKAEAPASGRKLIAAGAASVVAPPRHGGMRIASEMIRPHIVTFLDRMLREEGGWRICEVEVTAGSEFAGRSIAEARITERTGLLVFAIRHGDGRFTYNPAGSTPIPPGSVLVVIADPDRLERLRALAGPTGRVIPVGTV